MQSEMELVRGRGGPLPPPPQIFFFLINSNSIHIECMSSKMNSRPLIWLFLPFSQKKKRKKEKKRKNPPIALWKGNLKKKKKNKLDSLIKETK